MTRLPSLRWTYALLTIGAGVVAGPAGSADNNTLEYAVKANFLYKFGDYVGWPPEVLGPPDTPAVICVVGADPFGRLLDDAVSGERIGEHPIAVRRLDAVTPESGCHILYVRDAQGQRTAEALKAVAGKPVLTITDVPDGQGSVGIINFVLRQNRVRFEIDEQTAVMSRLDISSKLLGLAVSVRARENRGSGQ